MIAAMSACGATSRKWPAKEGGLDLSVHLGQRILHEPDSVHRRAIERRGRDGVVERVFLIGPAATEDEAGRRARSESTRARYRRVADSVPADAFEAADRGERDLRARGAARCRRVRLRLRRRCSDRSRSPERVRVRPDRRRASAGSVRPVPRYEAAAYACCKGMALPTVYQEPIALSLQPSRQPSASSVSFAEIVDAAAPTAEPFQGPPEWRLDFLSPALSLTPATHASLRENAQRMKWKIDAPGCKLPRPSTPRHAWHT